MTVHDNAPIFGTGNSFTALIAQAHLHGSRSRITGPTVQSSVFESPWNHCERTGRLGDRETFSVALDSHFSFNKYQILSRAQYLTTAEQGPIQRPAAGKMFCSLP